MSFHEPRRLDTRAQQQRHLLKGFETHPELMKRFLSILALADEPNAAGIIRSADEVEDLLIEQTRLLGKETLDWSILLPTVLGV